ncbi:MAG: bifunctional pyr operon transcriptional regulator/uracil phosphoribosyltransferase PyrR [Deltaproteobacteria bacterium]|nr:bifunctional pyr operon transcriptional regulator/uracil phosphoribosyltransferase PyrR [Deltaproteobacteria bacterium]MBI2990684.1 bifunctional pyr operon transcriptional regulator/uracil phosphoribosyltransferase PyrR [Deltaproteobacteria bacterium]MBI3060759.1 bifunctional pyr operon transcriptional regulator/uracil phosphoribosyltransferase PyrR [Deltaproteobacteria bacterium]
MKKTESKKVLNGEQIKQSLERFCRDILREHKSPEQLAFIGIRTRGIYLAKRLGEMIKRREGREVPVGEMDIALYRDDLNTLLPEGRVDHTRIPFDVANKSVILVDDVLHTGRTVRAAVDHLIDLGRPRLIHLAVLIDRGGREFPIAANYVGKKVKLTSGGEVRVRLKEADGKDEVIITG